MEKKTYAYYHGNHIFFYQKMYKNIFFLLFLP